MPATSASPWTEGRRDRSGRGDEREDPADGRGRRRVHPHQDEVVALREHVLAPSAGAGSRRSGRGRTCASPAMRIASSVPSAVIGPAGSAGQTLWASSITMAIGSRVARRQSRSSTAAAVIACSSRVPSEPRSTTRQRGPAGSSSSASSDSPWARPDAEALDSEVASPQLQRCESTCAKSERLRMRSSSTSVSAPRTPRGPRAGRAAAPPPAAPG